MQFVLGGRDRDVMPDLEFTPGLLKETRYIIFKYAKRMRFVIRQNRDVRFMHPDAHYRLV